MKNIIKLTALTLTMAIFISGCWVNNETKNTPITDGIRFHELIKPEPDPDLVAAGMANPDDYPKVIFSEYQIYDPITHSWHQGEKVDGKWVLTIQGKINLSSDLDDLERRENRSSGGGSDGGSGGGDGGGGGGGGGGGY